MYSIKKMAVRSQEKEKEVVQEQGMDSMRRMDSTTTANIRRMDSSNNTNNNNNTMKVGYDV